MENARLTSSLSHRLLLIQAVAGVHFINKCYKTAFFTPFLLSTQSGWLVDVVMDTDVKVLYKTLMKSMCIKAIRNKQFAYTWYKAEALQSTPSALPD